MNIERLLDSMACYSFSYQRRISVSVVAVNLTIAPNLMSLVELDVNEHSNTASNQTSPSQVSCVTTNPPSSPISEGVTEPQPNSVEHGLDPKSVNHENSQNSANDERLEEAVMHDQPKDQIESHTISGPSSSPQLLTNVSHPLAMTQSKSDSGITEKEVKFSIGSGSSIDTNASTNQPVIPSQGLYIFLHTYCHTFHPVMDKLHYKTLHH